MFRMCWKMASTPVKREVMVLRTDSRMEVMELVTDGILVDGAGEVVFDEI